MKWDCLEPLAAIGCGLAVCAAPIDGGITAALVGGAGLLARFNKARAKAGFDDARLIEKMRVAVIRDWERDDQPQEERDAVGLAATAIGRHIADCLPTREELAATALQGERVYPAAAARLVVDRLAARDALFAAPEAGGEPSIARRFALDVVERALRQAKEDPDYAPLLTLDLVIEIAGGVGRIEAMLIALVEEYRPAAEKLKVTDDALLALARKIADKIDDPQQALDALGKAIDEFVRLRAQAVRGTNLGDLVDQTLRNIAAANDRGALDEGAREGERAFVEWREQQEAVRQAGLRLIEANVEQHRLRFDAEAMAHWVCERLALEAGGAIDFRALRAEQDHWYAEGRDRGLRLELDVSIALARRSVSIARLDTERAAGWIDLAISLQIQGERTGGEAELTLLADAVAACRAALAVYTEAARLTEWAMAQNNLGNALQNQGERTNGEAGLTLLADAVAAYHAALTVNTEAAMPTAWAGTQTNLGSALQAQGRRTGGGAGQRLLADAVAAYRAALTVRTEAVMPFEWAGSQNDLGNGLQIQGQRTSGETGRAVLAEAVVAYRAALTVFTEAATPADWAMVQNNLGSALQAQYELTGGEAGWALLAEAVVAYRAALTVFTAEHFGPQHKSASHNLARVEALIAERRK